MAHYCPNCGKHLLYESCYCNAVSQTISEISPNNDEVFAEKLQKTRLEAIEDTMKMFIREIEYLIRRAEGLKEPTYVLERLRDSIARRLYPNWLSKE